MFINIAQEIGRSSEAHKGAFLFKIVTIVFWKLQDVNANKQQRIKGTASTYG